MQVRDAVEDDAAALAALSDVSESALRNVVHDRTVRVLVDDLADSATADATARVRGFVSYDVRDGVVHLTQFGGDREAVGRLLEEPLRFAAAESMPVEVLVGEDDETMRGALEAERFELRGRGPAFGGTPTFRYRRDVTG